MALRNVTLALATVGMGCVGIGSAWAATPETPAGGPQADVSQMAQAPAIQLPATKVEAVVAPPILIETAVLPGKTLDNAALGDLRGSGGIVVGNQTLNAISSGNSTIGNYTAGAVNISQSALSNFNGLGNITINTGAMSQLQSAMNVTVNVTP